MHNQIALRAPEIKPKCRNYVLPNRSHPKNQQLRNNSIFEQYHNPRTFYVLHVVICWKTLPLDRAAISARFSN